MVHHERQCDGGKVMVIGAPDAASLAALVAALDRAAVGGEWCFWTTQEFEEQVRRLRGGPPGMSHVTNGWLVVGAFAGLWYLMRR